MMNWRQDGSTVSMHFWTTWLPFWSLTHLRTLSSSSAMIHFCWSKGMLSRAFWITRQPYIWSASGWTLERSWKAEQLNDQEPAAAVIWFQHVSWGCNSGPVQKWLIGTVSKRVKILSIEDIDSKILTVSLPFYLFTNETAFSLDFFRFLSLGKQAL